MSADGQLWYLMIDKKRVGPITEDDVREKYEQREIGPRTYAWTPGQGKWERLFNLPDLFSTDTMRGTGASKDPKFKSTMPMPMLGDEETQPPAEPDDFDADDLAEVDPHAVTTQWDPDEVEAAILEVEAQSAKVEPGPEDDEPGSADDEPEELVAKSPKLEDDLAELFGKPTGPNPQQREVSTPNAASEPPVREVSTPDAASEPPVREVSTPDAASEPPVREVSTPNAASEPPVREVSTPDAAGADLDDSTPDLADLAPVDPLEDLAPVDPLADTSPHDPADDLVALDAIRPKDDSDEQKPELKSSLLGARDEDSVLFSRDQLDDLVQSLGFGTSDDESEQSLVDIKPLADDTLATMGGGDDLAAAPLPVAAPAANIMFPTEEPAKHRSLVSTLLMSFVGIILAFGLLVGVLYLVSPNLIHAILEGKLDKQIAGTTAVGGAQPQPGTATPGAQPAAPGVQPTEDAPPAKTSAPTEVAPGTTKVARANDRRAPRKGPRRKRGKGKRPNLAAVDPTRTATPVKAEPTPRAAPPRTAPVALPAAKKPAKKGGDELDRLIDGALDGKSPKAAPKKAPAPAKKTPPPPAKNPLTREVFNMAMSMAEDDVNACGKRHGKRGVVTIKISINGNTGRINGGRAVGSTAGTAVGTCVVSAAKKSARFPKFGGSRTMSYAYILK